MTRSQRYSLSKPTFGASFDFSDEELEALFSMAHQLHSDGMQSKARDLFVFIAACRPRSVEYQKALGLSLMCYDDFEAAIPVLAKAILCDRGNDPALSVACAECMALTGRHRQARRLFNKVRVALRQFGPDPETDELVAHVDDWLLSLQGR